MYEEYPDSSEIYGTGKEEKPVQLDIEDPNEDLYEERPVQDTAEIYKEDNAKDAERYEKLKEKMKEGAKDTVKETKKALKETDKKIRKYKPGKMPKLMRSSKGNMFGTSAFTNNKNFVSISKPNVGFTSFTGYGENVNITGKTPQLAMALARQKVVIRRKQNAQKIRVRKIQLVKQDEKFQQTFMTRNRITEIQGVIPNFNLNGLNVATPVKRKSPHPAISRIKPMGIAIAKNNKKNVAIKRPVNNFAVVLPAIKMPVLRNLKKRRIGK